jgi:hypothetical protein
MDRIQSGMWICSWKYNKSAKIRRINWCLQDSGQLTLALKERILDDACHMVAFGMSPLHLARQKLTCSHLEASDNTQDWKLEYDESCQPGPFSNWMAHVPEDNCLSQLSIPATHQTTAINSNPLLRNATCQRRPVYEQLIDGVRVFDLRFGRCVNEGMEDSLHAIHGPTCQYVSLGAVFQSLKLFLTQCPKEAVVIKLRNEDASEGFLELFLPDFMLFVNTFPNMFLVRDGETRMCDVRLAQASGKIILLIAAEGAGQLPCEPHEDPYVKYWIPEREFWQVQRSAKL